MPTPWGCCCQCRVCFALCGADVFPGVGTYTPGVRIEVWQGSDDSGPPAADQYGLGCVELAAETTYFYRATVAALACDGEPDESAACVYEGTFTTPTECTPFVVRLSEPCRVRVQATVIGCFGCPVPGATVELTGGLSGTAVTDDDGRACLDASGAGPFGYLVTAPRYKDLAFPHDDEALLGTLTTTADGSSYATGSFCYRREAVAHLVPDDDHVCGACQMQPDPLGGAGPVCGPCVPPLPRVLWATDRNATFPLTVEVSNWNYTRWRGEYTYEEPEAGLADLQCWDVFHDKYNFGVRQTGGLVTVGCMIELEQWEDYYPYVSGTACVLRVSYGAPTAYPTHASYDTYGAFLCDAEYHRPRLAAGTALYGYSNEAIFGAIACGEPIAGTVPFDWPDEPHCFKPPWLAAGPCWCTLPLPPPPELTTFLTFSE